MTIRDQIVEKIADAFGTDRDVPARSASEVCKTGVITQIVENEETVQQIEYNTYLLEMQVDIERMTAAESSTVTASQANTLLGQLISLIPEPADFLPVVVEGCRYDTGSPLRRGEGSALVGARVSLAVTYRTDVGDPDTLTEV